MFFATIPADGVKRAVIRGSKMRKNTLKALRLKLSVLRELFHFLWVNKLWWMSPIVVIFILLGVLLVFAHSQAAVPFIYALF